MKIDYDYDQLVEAFEYLDDLRESGLINMFGASIYVVDDLGHDKNTARELVRLWIQTYDETPATERAKSLDC